MLNIQNLCDKTYLPLYGNDCLNRSANRNYQLPESISLLLYSVYNAVGNTNSTVKVNGIVSFYAKYKKYSEATYRALANMSKQPFPLIRTGKAVDDNSMTSSNRPLVGEQNGWLVGQRYARISLTELGLYATRWYTKDDDPLNPTPSLIPITLLRHALPITLGMKEEMWSLNPAELFKLMILMLDHKSSEIPSADINSIFKGVDVGHNYISYTSDFAIKNLWKTGSSSTVVVPNIEVDRTNRLIIIKRPQCGSTSSKLRTALLKHIKQSILDGVDAFDTFIPGDTIEVNGSETFFRDVSRFIGTDEEIKQELWAHPAIQKVLYLTNLQSYTDENDKTKIDVIPIHETLWFHLQKEYEAMYNFLLNQINELKRELIVVNLIEKVTRDGVKEFIQGILLDKDRRKKLYEEFQENSTSELKAKYMSDTFLSTQEVDIVFKEKDFPLVQGERINILAVLPERQKYLNEFSHLFNLLKSLEDKLNNPDAILADIRNDLVKLASMPEHFRKTKANFVKDMDTAIKQTRLSTMVEWKQDYKNVSVPATLYYSDDVICKSLGANMNILDLEYLRGKTVNALNVCTGDTVAIVTEDNTYFETVKDMNMTVLGYRGIQKIIPNNYGKYLCQYYNSGTGLTQVIIFDDFKQIRPIKDSVLINCYDYNNEPYVDILTAQGSKLMIGRFNIQHLIEMLQKNNYTIYPSLGNILKVYPVKDFNADLNVSYYRTVEPIKRDIYIKEPNEFYEIEGNINFADNKSTEIYYGKFFIQEPTLFRRNYSKKSLFGKKFVFKENTYTRTSDNKSKQLRREMIAGFSEKVFGKHLTILSVHSSLSYRNFNVINVYDAIYTDLDDRFKVKGKYLYELEPKMVTYIRDYYDSVCRGEDVSHLPTPNEKYLMSYAEMKGEN